MKSTASRASDGMNLPLTKVAMLGFSRRLIASSSQPRGIAGLTLHGGAAELKIQAVSPYLILCERV